MALIDSIQEFNVPLHLSDEYESYYLQDYRQCLEASIENLTLQFNSKSLVLAEIKKIEAAKKRIMGNYLDKTDELFNVMCWIIFALNEWQKTGEKLLRIEEKSDEFIKCLEGFLTKAGVILSGSNDVLNDKLIAERIRFAEMLQSLQVLIKYKPKNEQLKSKNKK